MMTHVPLVKRYRAEKVVDGDNAGAKFLPKSSLNMTPRTSNDEDHKVYSTCALLVIPNCIETSTTASSWFCINLINFKPSLRRMTTEPIVIERPLPSSDGGNKVSPESMRTTAPVVRREH